MKYNHELLDYGFIEGVEFEPLMPAAAEKIGVVSVTPCVLRTHIVMGDSLFQSGLIYNIDLVRIQTVSRLPHTVRMVNGKHQS